MDDERDDGVRAEGDDAASGAGAEDAGAVDATDEERDLARDLVVLLEQGRKIEAVKRYREATGCGLKEAADFVNGVAREHGLATSSECSKNAAAILLIGAFVVRWLV